MIGSTLTVPLFTDVAADIATPLTSVAHFVRAEHGASLSGASETLRTALALSAIVGVELRCLSRQRVASAWEREAAGAGSRRRWTGPGQWLPEAFRRTSRPPAEATSAASRARSTRRSLASSTPPRTTSPAAPSIYGGGDSGYPPLRLATNVTLLRLVHGAARGLNLPDVDRDAALRHADRCWPDMVRIDQMITAAAALDGGFRVSSTADGNASSTAATTARSRTTTAGPQQPDGAALHLVQALDPSLTVNATTDSLLTADPCEDFSDELVLGCTDAAADNFNSDATVSDGSCRRRAEPTLPPSTSTRAPPMTTARAPCRAPAACSPPPTTTTPPPPSPTARVNTPSAAAPIRRRGGTPPPRRSTTRACVYPGCTDTRALNFDSTATAGDGGCVLPARGCTDSVAPNYAAAANVDDGSCARGGCTDPTALNFVTAATADDGSSEARRPGCVEPAAVNYVPSANDDDGSCAYAGCVDAGATNYASDAAVGDDLRLPCARLHRPEGRQLPIGRHRRRRQLRPPRLHAPCKPQLLTPPRTLTTAAARTRRRRGAAADGAAALATGALAPAAHATAADAAAAAGARAGAGAATGAGAAAGAACDAAETSPPSPPAAPCPPAELDDVRFGVCAGVGAALRVNGSDGDAPFAFGTAPAAPGLQSGELRLVRRGRRQGRGILPCRRRRSRWRRQPRTRVEAWLRTPTAYASRPAARVAFQLFDADGTRASRRRRRCVCASSLRGRRAAGGGVRRGGRGVGRRRVRVRRARRRVQRGRGADGERAARGRRRWRAEPFSDARARKGTGGGVGTGGEFRDRRRAAGAPGVGGRGVRAEAARAERRAVGGGGPRHLPGRRVAGEGDVEPGGRADGGGVRAVGKLALAVHESLRSWASADGDGGVVLLVNEIADAADANTHGARLEPARSPSAPRAPRAR